MDERIKTQLAGADVDVDEMLARFNHNESLAMKFLLRFPDFPCFSQLKLGRTLSVVIIGAITYELPAATTTSSAARPPTPTNNSSKEKATKLKCALL